MTVLVTGGGLVGSQVARLEIEAGRRPVIFDVAPQLAALEDALGGADGYDVVRGSVLAPLDIVDAVRRFDVSRIIHTAANPMLTAGAQTHPMPAIETNVMGAANVLEVARVMGLERSRALQFRCAVPEPRWG